MASDSRSNNRYMSSRQKVEDGWRVFDKAKNQYRPHSYPSRETARDVAKHLNVAELRIATDTVHR